MASDAAPPGLAEPRAGRCCVSGCGRPSELLPYHANDSSARPLYCATHIADGAPSHLGTYQPHSGIDRSVSHLWDCCLSSWFRSHCSKREALYRPHYASIPVTDAQRAAAQEEAERLTREQREREDALERQRISSGQEESYDR